MIRQLESKSFLFFLRDHLRSTLGITCGRGSFTVHFGDHLRSRDHLRLGNICGTVQRLILFRLLSKHYKFSNSPLTSLIASNYTAVFIFYLFLEKSVLKFYCQVLYFK